MRRIARTGVVVGVLGAVLGAAGSGGAAAANTRPSVVLHPRFHLAGHAFSVVSDGGRFAFINNPPGPPPGPHGIPLTPEHFSGGTLVDERTGKRRRVTRSGCEGLLAGGPWLLFYCHSATAPSYALYSMPQHGMVRTGMPATGGTNPVAIGTDWIQYFIVATGGYEFQNINTRRMRSLSAWRAGSTTIPDLNSRSLARKLCAPLHVPADWTPYARWSNNPFNEKRHAGTVTLVGRSAILSGTSHPDSSGAYRGASYVQRCGSRHKQPFAASPFAINSHLVIAGIDGGSALRVNAWTLPALAPLTISVPGYTQGLIAPYNATLSQRKLYLVDSDYQLWVAPSPAPTRSDSRSRKRI